MPQRMFRESRTRCKELGPGASPLERLALHSNVHRSGLDTGMTKGLNDAPGRAAFFPVAFISGLAARRLQAAPGRSGEGDRRDAPEHPRRLGEPLRHSGVFGRYKTPVPGFAGLRVAGRQTPQAPHFRSSSWMGQSAGTSTMMRRIEGSVCSVPIDGTGIKRIRWARSRGPAPLPTISRSNNPACSERVSCRRCAAASRNPVSRGAAEAKAWGAKLCSSVRRSKCRQRAGASYPMWAKDTLGGCVNN